MFITKQKFCTLKFNKKIYFDLQSFEKYGASLLPVNDFWGFSS